MIYFKRNILYPHKRSKKETDKWDRILRSYVQHVGSLKGLLPNRAWQLANLTFHDGHIEDVRFPAKGEVIINLRGAWVAELPSNCANIPRDFLESPRHELHFKSVKQSWVPLSIVGDTWLYEEIHVSEIATFDYQVLLGKDEIRIQADDVVINGLGNGQQVVTRKNLR